MEQLVQHLKNGDMRILEVPVPALSEGQLLVRNHYSVISAGTEGKTVKDARLGYIGKARARQKEVKQVIDLAKSQGIASTYNMVMNKLEAPSGLGYSCAGEVIALGAGVKEFRIGDLVACGGASAGHAEVVSVQKNLCVKIPEGVDLRHAAFSTIAAIAMQGVRQADLRLGENCLIIGLGLIGQLTVQLLNAAGVQTFGVDIDSRAVQLAETLGATLALERNSTDLETLLLKYTNGLGVDAAIITAGTSSLDPVEFAGAFCRQKGKVVVVGAVPTGFARANYYKKELELRMSCSYGPGRYDAQYEEKGIDYPIGYVRWTENRNMQSFVGLLQSKKLCLDELITHEMDFTNATEAYQMILDKKEPFVGIVLKYDAEKEIEKTVRLNGNVSEPQEVSIGFIGAGSFAQNYLLPNVSKMANMVGVATARGNSARNIADKYNFDYATGDANSIIEDKKINTVFIATRHNTHASSVINSLQSGKNVFVEKPLAMTAAELEGIRTVYHNSSVNGFGQSPRLMVGFNRRFAPHVRRVKDIWSDDTPKAISYRINAGAVPPEHWVNDPEIGGGRIIGEVCHFVDLCMYLAGAKITSLSAHAMPSPYELLDTISVNLSFANGSVASIAYFSNGNKSVNKEYIEIFCAKQVAIVDDFKEMTLYGERKSKYKLPAQDKGYSEELHKFVECVKNGLPSPIAFEDLYLTTLATMKIIESIQSRETVIF